MTKTMLHLFHNPLDLQSWIFRATSIKETPYPVFINIQLSNPGLCCVFHTLITKFNSLEDLNTRERETSLNNISFHAFQIIKLTNISRLLKSFTVTSSTQALNAMKSCTTPLPSPTKKNSDCRPHLQCKMAAYRKMIYALFRFPAKVTRTWPLPWSFLQCHKLAFCLTMPTRKKLSSSDFLISKFLTTTTLMNALNICNKQGNIR